MKLSIRRREFLIGTATLGLVGAAPQDAAREIAAIEAEIGGRIGVAALDTSNGRRIDCRSGERFAMASTFKLLLAAQILMKADKGEISLDKMIPYTEKDLLPHSPVTTAHVKEGALSVETLAEAAIEQSDNTAGNLLLAQIGGPAGLTAFARSIGDEVTRLDRNEMGLNTNLPGDERDTTSPSAMIQNLQKILFTQDVVADSGLVLISWMINCKTGLTRLRAGFPEHWTVGDKTGTGANGAYNDLAIAWPRGREGSPILVACYMDRVTANSDGINAAHARIAGIVAKAFT